MTLNDLVAPAVCVFKKFEKDKEPFRFAWIVVVPVVVRLVVVADIPSYVVEVESNETIDVYDNIKSSFEECMTNLMDQYGYAIKDIEIKIKIPKM